MSGRTIFRDLAVGQFIKIPRRTVQKRPGRRLSTWADRIFWTSCRLPCIFPAAGKFARRRYAPKERASAQACSRSDALLRPRSTASGLAAVPSRARWDALHDRRQPKSCDHVEFPVVERPHRCAHHRRRHTLPRSGSRVPRGRRRRGAEELRGHPPRHRVVANRRAGRRLSTIPVEDADHRGSVG